MMQNNPMGAMMPQGVAPVASTGLNFQSDPSMRAQFKGFMSGMQAKQPAPMAPMMQQPLPMSSPMQNIDIFQPSVPMQMAMGGAVPRNTQIAGQPHMLSYITPGEANVLQSMGGSGRLGPGGIPAFDYYSEAQGGGYTSGVDESAEFGGSGNTNFSSGSTNFSSGSSDDGGSTPGLNLVTSSGNPAGVGIRGNVITGGTIRGGNDPVAAGFGGGAGAGMDSPEVYARDALSNLMAREAARIDAKNITARGGMPDIVEDFDPTSRVIGMSQQPMEAEFANLGGAGTGAASNIQAISNIADVLGENARAQNNLLDTVFDSDDYMFTPDTVFDVDTTFTGPIGVPPEVQSVRGLEGQAMGPFDLANRVTPEGLTQNVVSGPTSRPVRSIYDVDPNYEENVGNPNFLSDAGRELAFTLKGSSLPENQKFNREAAELAADEGQPISPPSGPPSLGFNLGGMGAEGEAVPPPGASAAEVQAAIDLARATGDSAFTRQSEIGRLADLMDRQTTVTLADPKNRPGRVDPNTGLPTNVGATSVSSLEQLGRRAARGKTGIMGLVDKLTGFNPAEIMYNDIVQKGYSPVYDNRGQIIATVNPETGQIGAGSRSIDMNAISQTEGDLKAFIYNPFIDQNLMGGRDDSEPIKPITPPKPEDPESEEEVADDPVRLPPFMTSPVVESSGPAQVANPLGFGYGQISGLTPNLNSAADDFLRLLGGGR